MSSAEAGPARTALNCRALTRGLPLLFAAAPALASCGDSGFRPLYGPTMSGAGLQERLAQVDVAPIPGRVGQRIRNELNFQNTGGGNPRPPTHRLEVVDPRVGAVDTGQASTARRSARSTPSRRRSSSSRSRTRRWCCRARATAAPGSSASSRSTPTCARARMRRTAPRGLSPTT